MSLHFFFFAVLCGKSVAEIWKGRIVLGVLVEDVYRDVIHNRSGHVRRIGHVGKADKRQLYDHEGDEDSGEDSESSLATVVSVTVHRCTSIQM